MGLFEVKREHCSTGIEQCSETCTRMDMVENFTLLLYESIVRLNGMWHHALNNENIILDLCSNFEQSFRHRV